MFDLDEKEVCDYLRGWPEHYISQTEIARRACGRKRFRTDPNWAMPVLMRLMDRGVIETDSNGSYRLKPSEKKKKKNKTARWISPQMRKILEASGKPFDEVFKVDEDGEV